jgi:catechol-2,3-dioxygenase
MSVIEARAAKLAADRGRIPPSKFAHVVRRTAQFEKMVAWYETVLAAKVVHSNGMLAFLTYDDEHHRVAIAAFPGLAEAPKEMCVGTDHVAFNHADLGDLLHTWARLRQEGIEPYWCINHGPTTSMYYRDPDGNGIEFQVDNFPTLEECERWMRGEEFAANPVGVIFDPEELLARYRSGEPMESLQARPSLPAGTSPLEMLPLPA